MSESDFRNAESRALADRLDMGMKTKRSQRMPSNLLPTELEAQICHF